VDPDPNPDFRIGAQYVKNYPKNYHFRETGRQVKSIDKLKQ